MAVPSFFLPVNSQVDIYAFFFHPYFLDLFQLDQILGGTGSVDNIHAAVLLPVIQHIIDHGTQRRKSDPSGDKQKILAQQLIFYREMIVMTPTLGIKVSNS